MKRRAALILAATLVLAAPGGTSGAAVWCAGQSATIEGTTGNDVLVGTDSDDVIYAGTGHDLIDAGKGDDIICAGGGDDVVYAGPGTDVVYGQAGDDLVLGGPHFDTLVGDGDDVLAPGTGFGSRLNGGTGNDRFQILDGRDHRVEGRTGRDTLDFRRMTVGVYVSAVGDYFYVGATWDFNEQASIERFFLTPFDDDIDGDIGSQLIRGMGGADTLKGEEGNDRIFGDAGDDGIWGGDGDDWLDGGAGIDQVFGQNGVDSCLNYSLQTGCDVFP